MGAKLSGVLTAWVGSAEMPCCMCSPWQVPTLVAGATLGCRAKAQSKMKDADQVLQRDDVLTALHSASIPSTSTRICHFGKTCILHRHQPS